MRFPDEEDYLRKLVPSSLLDEIIKGVAEFPNRVAKLAASGRCFVSKGPFPIRHPDLFPNNIIVTNTFHVLGVIDCEGACTMP